MDVKDTPELNYYPINTKPEEVEKLLDSNNSGVAPSPTNVVPGPNGSILNGGTLTSPNFSASNAGWRLDSNGNIEANDGNFRGDITGASGTFSGTLTAAAGTIGGWTINATSIYTGTEDHSGYTANAGDVTIYSSGAVASLHFKNLYVDTSGNLFATSVTVSGAITAGVGSSIASDYLSGIIAQANLNISNRGWSQTCAFSVTDADTVAWGAGTFTSADGTAYSISGSNTGNMAAKTYIYLDTAVSTTAYQTTTTATTAVGTGKVLVAIAENGTTEATFKVMAGQGGENIDAATIVAGSITANEIAASTITAGKLSVANLASIVADLGAITAGTITLNTAGWIKGGQTDYNTGTGFFLGYKTDAYKFSIGNSADSSKLLTWDGTDLTVNDSIIANQDIFGDGSDGDLTTTGNVTLTADTFYDDLTVADTHTLNTAGYRLFVKGTLTLAGTGKIIRNGNNGGNGGDWQVQTAGAAGAALAAGTIGGSVAGGVGGLGGTAGGPGNNGGDGTANNANAGLGVIGATGGGAWNGRTGGAGGTLNASAIQPRNSLFGILLYDSANGVLLQSSSGSGGGAGANDSGTGGASTGGDGGGGGSAGGIVLIVARKIIVGASAKIQANGGTGGIGGNGCTNGGDESGSGGGGAGGSGGVIILIYQQLTNSGTIEAAGGTGGAGGTGYQDGTIGSTGNAGKIIQLRV